MDDATQSYTRFIEDLQTIMVEYLLEKEYRKDVMEWLSVGIPAPRHDGFSRTRVPGSGTWYVESIEFKEWVRGTTQILIGSGTGSTPNTSQDLISRGRWKVLHYV